MLPDYITHPCNEVFCGNLHTILHIYQSLLIAFLLTKTLSAQYPYFCQQDLYGENLNKLDDFLHN